MPCTNLEVQPPFLPNREHNLTAHSAQQLEGEIRIEKWIAKWCLQSTEQERRASSHKEDYALLWQTLKRKAGGGGGYNARLIICFLVPEQIHKRG